MIFRRTSLILIIFMIFTTFAVHAVNIRNWQSITDMTDIRESVMVDDELWCATTGGILILDTRTREFRSITNTEGLQGIDIVCIEYDPRGYVWCALSSGLIQIYDLELKAWQFYRGFENQASIYDIDVHDGFVLVGFDNGIAQLRLDPINRWELYWIAEIDKVEIIFNDGENIWLSQDDRIRYNKADYPNLQIPSGWKSYRADEHFNSATVQSFFKLDSLLYAGTTNGLYRLAGDEWLQIFDDQSVFAMNTWNNLLHLVTDNGIYCESDSNWQLVTSEIKDANDLVSDNSATLWLSRPGYGLTGLSFDGNDLTIQNCVPNGPGTNSFIDMVVDQDGHLWTASATGGINYYNGQVWKSYNRSSGLPSNDFRAVEVDENNRVWAGSWGGGVVRFEKITPDSIVFENLGSMDGNLSGIPSNSDYIVIRDIYCDKFNNMWFLNYLAADKKVLHVMDSQGRWQHWTTVEGSGGIISNQVSQLAVDDSDRIWVATDNSGLSVLDYGESLDNKSDDDLSGYLNTAEGLASDEVHALAYDLDGTMWIGTLEGLNYWFAGSVSTNYNVINDVINAILVDPRNNKWFGTRGGLSVMQFDGVTWDHYSTSDSPIVSNNITCFALNRKSGDLYIGTSNGLSVLETPFTQPEESLDQVIGYPNPYVIENSGSLFYLDRLAANSAIKIFTAEGRLIRTIPVDEVPGAKAVWDGKNDSGERIASGIYIYLITAENGERRVGKVAVITP